MRMTIHVTLYLAFMVMLSSCSTIQLVNQWKNLKTDTLSVSKVLVMAMSPDLRARQLFESQLKKEYESRGITTVMSLDLFDPEFNAEAQSKEQLLIIEKILIANLFDAVLFTKLVGVENVKTFTTPFSNKVLLDMTLKDDYYRYQSIVHKPSYYENYKVYHVESSLYCICPTERRSLIWKASIDITDPQSVERTVKAYTALLLRTLEGQQVLPVLPK